MCVCVCVVSFVFPGVFLCEFSTNVNNFCVFFCYFFVLFVCFWVFCVSFCVYYSVCLYFCVYFSVCVFVCVFFILIFSPFAGMVRGSNPLRENRLDSSIGRAPLVRKIESTCVSGSLWFLFYVVFSTVCFLSFSCFLWEIVFSLVFFLCWVFCLV